jgi:hypothetical protein
MSKKSKYIPKSGNKKVARLGKRVGHQSLEFLERVLQQGFHIIFAY